MELFQLIEIFFRDHIEYRMTPQVKTCCIWVSSWTSHTDVPINVEYKATLKNNQEPTIEKPSSGKQVLKYSYSCESSDDTSKVGLATYGKLELRSNTLVTVEFEGSSITIVQTLSIFMYLRREYTSISGNIVSRKITDKYDIAINQAGELKVNLVSTPEDSSEDPSTNIFEDLFTSINGIKSSIRDAARDFVNTQLHDIPVDIAQGFIYPGGRTFAFKDVQFSSGGDLVSKITYVDNF